MIIKRYVADTMNEALRLIKIELGSEAVIVSKRNIRQAGIMGFFLPRKIEVTAALDENLKNEASVTETNAQTASTQTSPQTNASELEMELSEVKQMLKQAMETKKVKKNNRMGMKKLLLSMDVHEDVVGRITDSIREKEEYKNVKKIPDSAYLEEIGGLIKADHLSNGKVYAFIGPTGVGKTTTIAKLAAIHSLKNKKKVGLITIDTYRIGAVQQLKIYADILSLPFEVINSVSDIDKAMESMKDCDIILVDTTGRSIRNIMQLSELKLYLAKIKPDVTYLVMSMTTKYKDMLQILNGFSDEKYDGIILTKFDETTTYGSILNVACSTKTPISYITAGQNVPDDIEQASKEKLLELLFGEGSI